jgi:hypothetical protein
MARGVNDTIGAVQPVVPANTANARTAAPIIPEWLRLPAPASFHPCSTMAICVHVVKTFFVSGLIATVDRHCHQRHQPLRER